MGEKGGECLEREWWPAELRCRETVLDQVCQMSRWEPKMRKTAMPTDRSDISTSWMRREGGEKWGVGGGRTCTEKEVRDGVCPIDDCDYV